MDAQHIKDLYGATVVSDSGDKIGKVADVFLDDITGEPKWLTVKTGLLGSSPSFIPLGAVAVEGGQVRVPYDKGLVKGAPRLGDDGDLSPDQERELYRHYGLSAPTGTGTDTGTGTGTGIATGGADGQQRGRARGRGEHAADTGEATTSATGSAERGPEHARPAAAVPVAPSQDGPVTGGRDGSADVSEQSGTRSDQPTPPEGEDSDQPATRGGQAGDSALTTSRGTTAIADQVVSKIAGIAAREVTGVHALGGGASRAFGSLRERIPGGSTNHSQGVSVEVGEKEAAADVVLIAEYGVSIADLASGVRQNVISSVERMTGLSVTEVNVEVSDVFIPGQDQDDSDSSSSQDERPSRVQ